jgi:tRNA(Ile)-lysidine synthase TilS/MesJ
MLITMNSDLNYPHWKKDNETILKNLPGKNIYILYSGGKDSSVTMDLLARAGKEFGFDFQAHGATYPAHRYTEEEKMRIESYWNKRSIDIVWHDVGETDDYIKNSPNPCFACQELRKKLMKKIVASTIDDWSRLVIIVAFSLWDITSYAVEHMLNSISPQFEPGSDTEKSKRLKEIAHRFHPLIKMKEGYSVFRPLLKYNNDEIKKWIEKEGIPILLIPCEFKDFRPKRILERYYERMGLSFDYDRVYDFAVKSLKIPDMSSYASIGKEEYFGDVF